MRLQVGSRWRDHQGQEFEINTIDENDSNTWVCYTRLVDWTSYRCLAEAFTFRFTRTENDSRT
jgi:hypothetical protein